MFSSKTEITPETNGNEFLVVVLSVPYDGLYPSPREHERIQERHRLDPDENPAAPAQSYALFVPSRFGLVTADGSRRPAAALAPYFTYRDGRLEYCPGPTVQSSTSTLDPRDRTLIAAAWEVGPEDAPDRFRVRFERWEPLAIPDLRLDEYRGDPTSGSAARRAGQGRGRGSLQVTRNYSEY